MTATARTVVLVSVPPLVAAAAGIVALLALAPQLPAELAVHWGVTGVDRVGGIDAFVLLTAILVPVFTAVLLVAALVGLRNGTTRGYLRVLIGLSTGFGIAISGGGLGQAVAQRGVEDVTALPAGTGLWPLLASAVIGGLVGFALSMLAPAVPVPASSGVLAAPLALAPGEIAYWSGRVRSPAGLVVLVIAATVLADVLYVIAGLPLWLPIVFTLVMAALGSLLGWHVVVDRRGLRATGLLGFPVVAVAPEAMTGARADTVRALADFGGWGMRIDSRGRRGLIVRSGSAIEVDRVGRPPLVITVDDAATAAALLSAVARG